jgi:spermidine synthase
MNHFVETLYDGYGQEFRIDEILYQSRTTQQNLTIFSNAHFGRVMALDGIVQTTSKDEFIYHEMLTHVPIIAHGNVSNVLIVGGGDGGILREVLKHPHIQSVVLVEIDREVIDFCREYLPDHSRGGFEDPRLELVVDNGMNYVLDSADTFDVIISDGTDPVGPGRALFSRDFYRSCRERLNTGGVLATQNGVAFMQLDEVIKTAGHLRELFRDWHFFSAAIPTYIGGDMAFGWATDNRSLRHTSLAALRSRCLASGLKARFYNPEMHYAAFALPQYVLEAIGKVDNEYR